MSTPTTVTPSHDPATTAELEQRQAQYYDLIDQLLKCPSGKEPELLDAHPDLLDEGLVRSLVQTATYFAHENNGDAGRFLFHVARELAKQLGLYPET
ncbi:MAG: hypothetical protein VKJ64_07920 [Leptolyngbyaceae bacterium]|nr:hypothetical protein [Leptolyngbyaceae bacterium]